jgi:tetratricopeptide (TPR) repeat protein
VPFRLDGECRLKQKLSFKEYEKKIDTQGLFWEKKQQPQKALEAYNLLMREIESTHPKTQQEKKERNAIIAYLMMRKAGILLETEKIEDAKSLMRGSVEFAERSGKATVIGRAKLGLGVYYGSASEFEEAENLLEEALETFSGKNDYDNKQGAAWCLLNLGGLQLKKSNLNEAKERLEEAIKLLKQIKNWVGVGTAYEMMARISKSKNDRTTTKKNLVKAISFFEKEGMSEKVDLLRNEMKML